MTPGGTAAPERQGQPDDALRAVLARGIAEGVITEDQAARLAALSGERADIPQDDERLRFITGFADIFVTIGLGLFLGAALVLGRDLLGMVGGSALLAALAWGLAEFFSRRRRMALPSIVLLAVFVVTSFQTLVRALGGAGPPDLFGIGRADAGTGSLLATAAAAAATLGLAALHYRRFRVPITVAAGTAALIGTILSLLLAAFQTALEPRLNLLLAGAGLATFALAMRFDLSDPDRLTRRADIAFWLHLLAAPLIVHPVLSDLLAVSGAGVTLQTALIVLGVVLLLSLIALVTDRRAILVSGLIYAGIAIGSLVRRVGVTDSVPLSLLTLGAFVLLLSAGWHPLRGALLRALPEGIRGRLPRPVTR